MIYIYNIILYILYILYIIYYIYYILYSIYNIYVQVREFDAHLYVVLS